MLILAVFGLSLCFGLSKALRILHTVPKTDKNCFLRLFHYNIIAVQIIYNIPMASKRKNKPVSPVLDTSAAPANPAADFIRRALPHVLGALVLLISLAFFTGTYDSAHVKLTLLQMGSVLLLSLWTCLKLTERKNPFTRRTRVWLAPLLVYLAWQTLSFLCFPYKLEAAEEFIRLWMYGGIIGLIACEFTTQDVRTVTRWLLAAAWVSFVYGALQIVNIWLPGVDLLPWHGFFGHRVFATHANPNFFGAFIVFVSAVAGAEFLRTRQKSLFILLGLGLLNLIFTESKGAWLAYAGTGVFFAFIYAHFLSTLKKHTKKIVLATVAGLLIAAAAAGVYSAKRFQSVSFRAYTWLSAFEMVKDSPVLGTGPGSFKLVYPAYRRPQIFYIENAHNTETQHAENELLEQAATGGLIGLALALWLLATLFIGTFKTRSAADGPRQTYLLGYSAALAGLLLHSVVDISVHFASSGVLLAVALGTLFALLLDNPPAQTSAEKPAFPKLLWGARALTALAALAAAGQMGWEFYRMMRNMAAHTAGETVLFVLAVLTFAVCVGGVLYIYGAVLRRTSRVCVCLLLLTVLPLQIFFFRLFAANHYYSLGVALVQLNQPEASLGAFHDAITRHPFLAEYRHYRANIFATTLNLTKQFSPARGDTAEPRTDYDRAIEDFRFVLAHNPNHALLHQDIGQLYYSLALRQLQAAQQVPAQAYLYQELAGENFALAHKAFTKALALDPVNPNTYALLVNMALMRHDTDEAQHWLDTYFKGPDGVTEEEFLEKHRANPQLRALQTHVNRLRQALP